MTQTNNDFIICSKCSNICILDEGKRKNNSYKVNQYYLEWHRKPFDIREGYIVERLEANAEAYNALEAVKNPSSNEDDKDNEMSKVSYLDFIECYNSDDTAILNFCNEYGNLFEDIPSKSAERTSPLQISIEQFKGEAAQLRLTVELYSCLFNVECYKNKSELESILTAYDRWMKKRKLLKSYKIPLTANIYLELIRAHREEDYVDVYESDATISSLTLELLKDSIKRAVLNIIKSRINDINVMLDEKKDMQVLSFKGSLLSAMYFRFYLDTLTKKTGRKLSLAEAEESIPIRICRNEKCNKIFNSYYRYKKYFCCPNCSAADRMRRSRAKNK